MSADHKARLIERLERLRLQGKGARLTADELALLFVKPPAETAVVCAAGPVRATRDESSPLKIHDENRVEIRWLIRRDMPEVLRIEQASFGSPWNDEDFLCCLRQRNCIGMVAEYDHRILGFMIYELHKSRLHILNFAVHPDHRRQSIVSQMVERLIDKLAQQRRNNITLEVRESNVEFQLFLRQMGFNAQRVLKDRYEDTGEDAYLLQYQVPAHPENEVLR